MIVEERLKILKIVKFCLKIIYLFLIYLWGLLDGFFWYNLGKVDIEENLVLGEKY